MISSQEPQLLFSERLYAEASKKGVTLPMSFVIEASSEREVHDFLVWLKNRHGEDIVMVRIFA